jgi:hypothetical protein
MSDKTFTWWDSKGGPHTGRITYFQVPPGVKLGPPHKCVPCDSEGNVLECPGVSEPVRLQETEPFQTE